MIGYALSRRWLAWHLLWAVAVVVCLRLAVWQWHVASAPHPPGAPVEVWRNYAYAVNWVIFAVVAVWFWWRFIHDQYAEDAQAAAAAAADPGPLDGGAPADRGATSTAATSATGSASTSTAPAAAVRDPRTGGRVRFDPFAEPADLPGGGVDDAARGAGPDSPSGR